jgi:hypothetical protein
MACRCATEAENGAVVLSFRDRLAADDRSVAIRGKRDRLTLAGQTDGVAGNELGALLRPSPIGAGEHPCRPGGCVVSRTADDRCIPICRQTDGVALLGVAGVLRLKVQYSGIQSVELRRASSRPHLEPSRDAGRSGRAHSAASTRCF